MHVSHKAARDGTAQGAESEQLTHTNWLAGREERRVSAPASSYSPESSL